MFDFAGNHFADRLAAKAAQTASICDWRREVVDKAISKTLAVQRRLIACHLLFLEARGAKDEKPEKAERQTPLSEHVKWKDRLHRSGHNFGTHISIAQFFLKRSAWQAFDARIAARGQPTENSKGGCFRRALRAKGFYWQPAMVTVTCWRRGPPNGRV